MGGVLGWASLWYGVNGRLLVCVPLEFLVALISGGNGVIISICAIVNYTVISCVDGKWKNDLISFIGGRIDSVGNRQCR